MQKGPPGAFPSDPYDSLHLLPDSLSNVKKGGFAPPHDIHLVAYVRKHPGDVLKHPPRVINHLMPEGGVPTDHGTTAAVTTVPTIPIPQLHRKSQPRLGGCAIPFESRSNRFRRLTQ